MIGVNTRVHNILFFSSNPCTRGSLTFFQIAHGYTVGSNLSEMVLIGFILFFFRLSIKKLWQFQLRSPFQFYLVLISQNLSEIVSTGLKLSRIGSLNLFEIVQIGFKGQIISECPYEIIVSPIRPTKKFPRFLP